MLTLPHRITVQKMVIPLTLLLLWSAGCTTPSPPSLQSLDLDSAHLNPWFGSTTAAEGNDLSREALLAESWAAYRRRFIQSDGRVIDWEDGARTVSEGQAYAMLRAVLADDPDTFDLTLTWAENNLRRSPGAGDANDTATSDQLWAWKWGRASDGTWGILDENFASDADIDAVTALILAARRWQRPEYLDLARLKLADLWDFSTLALPAFNAETPRYLLPGPLAAFQPEPGMVYLNPSYLSPYAFRLFAQVDPDRDWLALVESSYRVLDQIPDLSPQGLPGDWVRMDLASQTLAPIPAGSTLQGYYGFDAYRVWWRIAWDWIWFQEPRAKVFLEDNLLFLGQLWQEDQQIPARLSLTGEALVDYEATAQYAMLYPAFREINPTIATEIFDQKLMSTYRQGIWDDANAYYVQNLAWLGLFPLDQVPTAWIRPAIARPPGDP